MRHHRLPDDILSRLASGGGGQEAARHLVAAERSKHRLLVLGVTRLAAGHPHARAVGHAYDVLAEIERKRPEAVRDTLGYPAVGAWAACTVQALTQQRAGSLDPAQPDPAQLGAVASVAAVKAEVACRVEVPATDGTITLPSFGQIVCPGGGELVDLVVHADGQVEAGGVRVRAEVGQQPGWRPLCQVGSADGTLSLLVDDLDPYRWIDQTVIDGRLPEDELRAWRTCLDEAWGMLRKQHWTIADETRAIVSVLTPIQAPSQGMNSALDGGRFGAVAMSTPPDGRWLASTFAHEVQHAKLGAILDIVRLLEPDDGRYYAPWRPDPRPLSGLIQGTYAYLGVSGFWRRQRAFESDMRPHIEFAHWRESAYTVTGTLLDSGRLTATGEAFVTGMRRTLAAWLDESVPAAALDVARREADEHRQAWLTRNCSTD
ncbi:HEXXH motif domain-containing protein [Nonomuraea guangzhouensis]|uniref:HEXXH motif domain-containing protein n=1 Tax=Nonomuraea guangzhouensis TaxID=1291555 RepID=A0ABW4GPD3_9ACTN|nr:HEXXH motif domain-containing protein [Nonomuraea guangzhouensis]